VVKWEDTCAAVQGVASLSHTLVVLFVYSTQDTFDVLTQDGMLKVLDLLFLHFLTNFQKADMGLDLGFWIRIIV